MKTKDKVLSLIEIGAKTAMSLLPNPISAAFNAVLDNIKNNVLNNRVEKWKEDVISRLEKLESDYESLVKNEAFATALIKTSELAIKTGSDEKRQILADAIINCYLCDFDDNKTQIFLQLIEKYTVLHVQIIKYFCEDYMHQKYFEKQSPTILSFVRRNFMSIDETYFNKLIKDLENDYLIETVYDNSKVEVFGHRFEMITPLGKEFYNFLKAQDPKK